MSNKYMQGKEFYKQVLFFALPVAFQQTINIGVNLMDTVMVGMVSELSLSAVSLANQYYYLYYILCLGISGGACVMSAQYYGHGDFEKVKQVWRFSMYLAVFSAIIFAGITFAFSKQIMLIYSPNNSLCEQGAIYLRITTWVFFFHGTSLIMVNLLRTVGAINLGLVVSSISFFVNIFFNYIFIFGKLGAPCLGIAGAALGTLLSRIAEFVIVFVYLFLQKHMRFYPLEFFGRLSGIMLRTFVRIAVPVIISDGLYTLGDNVLSVILGHMSSAMVSANSITLTVMRLCTAFIMGINVASNVIVGQAIGRGESEVAQKQGNTFALLAAVGGVLGGTIIWICCPYVISIYSLSEMTANITYELMAAMSLLMVFQSVSSVLSKGVLRGGGDTRFLVLADLAFLWGVNIPLGYMSGLVWAWSPFWVFVCLKLDTICKTILCVWRLSGRKWIQNINLNNKKEVYGG